MDTPPAVVPMVFAPVSVNAVLGSGTGPAVYESDQSEMATVVEVEALVRSAVSLSPGYVVVEIPVSDTGNEENPAVLPVRAESGRSVPFVSATRTSAVVPAGVERVAWSSPHPFR